MVLPTTHIARTDDTGIKITTIPIVQQIKQPDIQPIAEVETVYVAPIEPTPPTVVIPNCGDNEYANYIYMHESGCSTTAINSLGCRGIGQACPGDKLPCGADYACQNAFFTSYALGRYGSWYNAYVWWLNNHWW
jgi:hypothetical protein